MNNKSTIPATLEAVSKFTQELETQLSSLSLEMRTLVILAIQELLVNIVQHAYDGDSGQISFDLIAQQQELHITIIDNAKTAFEMPEEIAEPDPLELTEHGMGLFIIHQSFDNVRYTRLANGNQWELVKALE